jgi:hypothetical protein
LSNNLNKAPGGNADSSASIGEAGESAFPSGADHWHGLKMFTPLQKRLPLSVGNANIAKIIRAG